MRSKLTVVGLAALLASSFAIAQESSLLGKYSGSFQPGGGSTNTVILDIQSIQDGKVSGTVTRISTARKFGCGGEYKVEGTLRDNMLDIRATEKGGPAADCEFRLTGTIAGGKILAKLGQREFAMTK